MNVVKRNTCNTDNTYKHIIQLVKGGWEVWGGVRWFFTSPSEFTEFKKRVLNETERRRLLQDFHGLVVLRWVGVCLGQLR